MMRYSLNGGGDMPGSRDEDPEIVRRVADVQARARDFRMMDLPGYMAWSAQMLEEGESDALIAHLDATSAWLLPEHAAAMTDADYDNLLETLKTDLGEGV